MSRADNPYVGPRPFRREDQDKLFGRDEEIRDLLAMIGASPVTLLYAQSGAGKTSLLDAKLIPLLERRPAEIVGPTRVTGSAPLSSANVYVPNALSRLPGGAAAATLADYLASLPKEERKGVIRPPRVLIFDQFEELFTRYPDRWEERTAFFEEIADALEADPRLRVVFAMREEYLAAFESYAEPLEGWHPTRYRLERLRREAAIQAVLRPLDPTPVRFAPGTAETLVDNLMRATTRNATPLGHMEEFAEPVQIQIVCQQLWDSLDPSATEIDARTIETYADVNEALRSYYGTTVDRVVRPRKDEKAFPADKLPSVSEGALRNWIERTLITSDGFRSMMYRSQDNTVGMDNAIVDALEALYMLRAEVRGETIWYELSHERFIKPILESNRAWRERIDPQRRMAALRTAADSWAQHGKPPQDLLTGRELKDAEQWLATAEATEIGVSEGTREYLQTARRVADREAARRLRLQALAALLVTIVVGGLALTAYRQRAEALRARQQERKARFQAERAGKESERARHEAEHALSLAHTQIARAAITAGRPWDATVSAIRAVSSTPVSDEAVTVLREAVRSTGGTPWLRRPDAMVEVAVSYDDKLVATHSARELCVWETSGRRIGCRTMPDQSEIQWLFFSPASRHVGVSLQRKQESGLETRRGEFYAAPWFEISREMKPLREGLAPKASKRIAAFCKGDTVLFQVADGAITMEETSGGQIIARIAGEFDADKTSVFASDDCRRFVTVSDGSVDLWDGHAMRRIAILLTLSGSSRGSMEVEFSRAGSLLVYEIFGAHPPTLFDAETGNRKFELPNHNSVWYVFSPDGKKVVTEDAVSNEIVYFDTKTGAETGLRFPIGSFRSNHYLLRTIVQYDEKTNAIQGRVTDVNTQRVRNFTIPATDVGDADFSSDGNLAAVIQRGSVRIWDLTQPTPNYDKAAIDALRHAACRTLTFQEEFRDLEKACGKTVTRSQ